MSLSLAGSKCNRRVKIKYEMMYHDSMTYIIHYRNITAHILVLMYYNVMCITKRMKRGAQHNPVIITNKGLAVSFGRGLFDYNSDYCWRENSMWKKNKWGRISERKFSTKIMLIVWMIWERKSYLTFHSTPHIPNINT